MPIKFTRAGLLSLLIVMTTAACYSPLFLNGFINYDDPAYIVNNTHLRTTGISPYLWALSATYASNWHPLTWWLHTVNVSLFGLAPAGHHAVSLILHAATSLLLFFFLRRATGAEHRSAMVALLFALHPLHVESVAWAAELKDVLCAFLWMLTLHAYYNYTKKPGLSRYALFALSFTAGLAAKAMMVTLPAVLLLLDVWPLGRLHAQGDRPGKSLHVLLLEKVPLIIPALAVSVITVIAQKAGGSLDSFRQTGMAQCIGNALLSYTAYLHKLFWPARLAVVYPFDPAAVTLTAVATATLILVLLTAITVMKAKTQPYLLVGWLWYLGTLAPVIGFVRIGHHAMADRYTYLPSIGIFIMVVWGIHHMAADSARRQLFAGIVFGVTLLVMMVLTWIQVGWWRDSYTLFTHAISTTGNNWLAYNNLGTDLLRHGKTAQATDCFRETIRIAPDYPDAHNNLGTACETSGNTAEAIEEFRIAASLNPKNPDIHFNLGLAYHLAGRTESAAAELRILQTLDSQKAGELMTVIEKNSLVKTNQ